jgi:hypothetical protein
VPGVKGPGEGEPGDVEVEGYSRGIFDGNYDVYDALGYLMRRLGLPSIIDCPSPDLCHEILEAGKWPTGEPFTDADKRALTYIVKNLYREQGKNDTTPSTAS